MRQSGWVVRVTPKWEMWILTDDKGELNVVHIPNKPDEAVTVEQTGIKIEMDGVTVDTGDMATWLSLAYGPVEDQESGDVDAAMVKGANKRRWVPPLTKDQTDYLGRHGL